MNNLQKTLLNEIPEFRDYTLNFINGNMSTMQYKEFAAAYGVYSQSNDKQLFLIRFRTSCGVISRAQLHTIYQMAHKHNLNYIHITTRHGYNRRYYATRYRKRSLYKRQLWKFS